MTGVEEERRRIRVLRGLPAEEPPKPDPVWPVCPCHRCITEYPPGGIIHISCFRPGPDGTPLACPHPSLVCDEPTNAVVVA